jgi:class 3 adenylate cyclase
MHEGRIRILVAAFVALALASAVFVLANPKLADTSPLEAGLHFRYPNVTGSDSRGRMYVVDSGTRRLIAMDADGGFRWEIDGGVREGGFYYALGLAFDSQDRLYIYNSLPDQNGEGRVQAIQIQRYDSEGHFEKTVHELVNAASKDDFPQYFSFFIDKDRLFYILEESGVFTLWNLPVEGGTPAKVLEFAPPGDVVSVSGTGPGTMAAVARNGFLYLMDADGSWRQRSDLPLRKPWDARIGPDGDVFVLDILNRSIGRIARDRTASTLFTLQTPTRGDRIGTPERPAGSYADAIAVGSHGLVTVADKENHRIISIDPSGGAFRLIPLAAYSVVQRFWRYAFWVALAGGVAFLAAAGVLSYVFLVRRRLPLLVRQVGIFVPIIIAAQMVTYNQVYSGLYQRYQGEVAGTLLNAASLAARQLPAAEISRLRAPADSDGADYEAVAKAASALSGVTDQTGGVSYLSLYRMEGGAVYTVFTASGYYGVMYPYSVLPPEVQQSFEDRTVRYGRYEDDWGTYMAGFAPIVDASGKTVALAEVGLFADLVVEIENQYTVEAGFFALANSVAFVAIFIGLTIILLRSLNPLRRITREIANGNMDLIIELKSRDELGHLARDFHVMASHLKQFTKDTKALTEASSRFVPQEFIQLLGQDDLIRLRLGDQVAREMTVMFSSLQNFRRLTGHMSSQGSFNYLNSYYSSVVPHIRSKRGMIDKYIGDTYMALFSQTPLDALESQRLIRESYQKHNQKRARGGSETVGLSFGIHFGNLMLGIVGESQRLEGTVIADAVNLSSRLNGLCRIYQVGAVATESTLLQAADQAAAKARPGKSAMDHLRQIHPFRRLDYVRVKGKSEPVMICELVDVQDPGRVRNPEDLAAYELAFDAWMSGDPLRAHEGFAALAESHPQDPVVLRHRDRCAALVRDGLPADWTPAIKLTEK